MKLRNYIFVFCLVLYTSSSFAANILLVVDTEWEWVRRVNYITKKDASEAAIKAQMMDIFHTTLQTELIAKGHKVTVISFAELQKQTTGETILSKSKFSPMPKYKNRWDRLTSISPMYTSLNINSPELQPYFAAQLTKYDYIISLNRVNFSHNFLKAFFNRGKRQINMHYDIISQDKKLEAGKLCQMHHILKKSALPKALITMMNAPAKHLVLAFQPIIEKK
ncbi:MAG: hypothetical protein SGJ10_03800 [Bacteroidota bacterium]|nr:hypothetical protein [Bacteroidota bacterium]